MVEWVFEKHLLGTYQLSLEEFKKKSHLILKSGCITLKRRQFIDFSFLKSQTGMRYKMSK